MAPLWFATGDIARHHDHRRTTKRVVEGAFGCLWGQLLVRVCRSPFNFRSSLADGPLRENSFRAARDRRASLDVGGMSNDEEHQ